MHRLNIKKLVISILICELAGTIAWFFSAPSIASWYNYLNKPIFTPPSEIFGYIWALLYLMMGIALYGVWNKGFERPEIKRAVSVFGVQLALNVIWALIFFGSHNIGVALAGIIALWICLALTVVEFGRISRKAAVSLFPYLAWVSFAFFLNYAFWILNP